METGDCFHCGKPGHWANHCPLKTPTNSAAASPPAIHCPCDGGVCVVFTSNTKKNPNRRFYKCPSCGFFKWCDQVNINPESISDNPNSLAAAPPPCDQVSIKPELISDNPNSLAAAPPPAIHCPCDGGACIVLTSKTEKNPNRKFYKCPADPSCDFFKWCDQVSIKPEPISNNPTCPCGAGPCRRVTVTDGPNAHRSYFVCCIKKGFGACGFFEWEDDARVSPESEEVKEDNGDGDSPCSTSIGFPDFGSADDESSGSCVGVVNGIAQPVKDYTDDAFSVRRKKPSIPVCSRFKNLEPVSSNGVFASVDVVRLEGEEEVLHSFSRSRGKESYALEVVESTCVSGETGLSQDIKDPVTSGSNVTGETGACSSLMHLTEQYNSEKLHFSSVSTKHADALAAFTGSYKRLEWFRDRADSLREQLFEVEKHVKRYEAEASESAASLEEVCDEMVKSQKKMVETAKKVAKEVRVYKAK